MKNCPYQTKINKTILVFGKDGKESIHKEMFLCKRLYNDTGERITVLGSICDGCTEEYYPLLKKDVLKRKEKKEKNKKNTNNLIKTSTTLYQKVTGIAGAAKRFIEDGCKIVTTEEFIERQICCLANCDADTVCKYCGCVLGLKARMNSERGCPNSITYPNLKIYPPKNYWRVCKETTSVIISARNEKYLNKTIENLLETATGKIEIIIVLDGVEQDVFSDKRVRTIINEKPLGKRISVNNAAKAATGEYLFIIDAHCRMNEGWDTKLKCAIDDRTITVNAIQSMDGDYNDASGRYELVSFNSNLEEKWAGKSEDRIVPMMCFTGCGWMIKKDYYWELGGHDETLGEWGHEGVEFALKVYCSDKPGQIVLVKDVICGHIFGTNKNNVNYETKVMPQNEFRKKMFDLYGDKILRLVERFWPVSGWERDEMGKFTKKEESVERDTNGVIVRRIAKLYSDDNNVSKIVLTELTNGQWVTTVVDDPELLKYFTEIEMNG